MTYQQVRDIVKRLRESHQQLRIALERPRSRTDDARTRLMLEELRREELDLQIILTRYEEESSEALLDTWLQYVPDQEVIDALNTMKFSPEMSADEVVAQKVKFDEAMLDLLKQLREQTAAPRIQSFFNTLFEYLKSRVSQSVWAIREFQADSEPPAPD